MPADRKRRRPHVVALVPGVAGVVAGLIGALARTVGIDWQPAIVAAAFFPFLAVAALVGGVLLAVVRWWPGAVAGLAVVVWTVVVQVPLFVAPTPPDELTSEELTRLTAAGLDRLLPHRLVVTFPGGAGNGIWSATPLESLEKIEDYSFELLGATISPAGAAPVHVVTVHLLPPWPYPSHT